MSKTFQTEDNAQPRAGWRGALLGRASYRLKRLTDLVPVTPLGAGVMGGAYAAIEWMAQAQLDLVWLVVGYVGLGLALLSPLVVSLSALWLKWRGPLAAPADALLLETGVFAETGFRLRTPWYLPLVQIRWEWLSPLGAEVELRRDPNVWGGASCERVKLHDRGRFDQITRRVVVSDAFGLGRVALRTHQVRVVDVLPRFGGLRHLPTLSALAAGDAMPHPMGLADGDRNELRRYMPGDSARYIHWKVFSRTRRLMVRTPERALSTARRTAAFLVAGASDDASAAVARLALEHKLLGADWIFGTDLDVAGQQHVGDALDSLMRSGSDAARSCAGTGLWAFVERVEREGPASLLVFAPSRPGEWLQRVTASARRRKLRVVIGIDGVYERAEPRLWKRLLAFSTAPLGTAAVELDEVVRVLAQAGAEVTVLDRASGQELGAAHRRAMLKLATQGAA